MAITACCAVPALAAPGSVAPESGTLYTSGTQTTTEGVALGKDMTFGSLSSSVIPGDSIPYGGNFYASSYTISLWLDSSSLHLPEVRYGDSCESARFPSLRCVSQPPMLQTDRKSVV